MALVGAGYKVASVAWVALAAVARSEADASSVAWVPAGYSFAYRVYVAYYLVLLRSCLTCSLGVVELCQVLFAGENGCRTSLLGRWLGLRSLLRLCVVAVGVSMWR
jgi:hypothetical protein